jgi:hypothetical protein
MRIWAELIVSNEFPKWLNVEFVVWRFFLDLDLQNTCIL